MFILYVIGIPVAVYVILTRHKSLVAFDINFQNAVKGASDSRKSHFYVSDEMYECSNSSAKTYILYVSPFTTLHT